MPEVDVFHWNPRRPLGTGPIVNRIRGRRFNNFGDLLGPIVVGAMLRRLGLGGRPAVAARRLLSVGSVMQYATPGTVVWGTGINGNHPPSARRLRGLDVRAVRGPATRELLLARGIDVPEVYGDPALLLRELHPQLANGRRRTAPTVVPNFADRAAYDGVDHLDPTTEVWEVLRTLATSSLVVGSSLHAVVIAEAFGVPARLVRSTCERPLKYRDYYAGTGRLGFRPAETVEEALDLGGEPGLDWNPRPLLDAFPADLWIARGKPVTRPGVGD